MNDSPRVVAVHRDREHRFGKPLAAAIELLEGLGVAGDAHCGRTVQHRSRVRAGPTQPNLRQVHLMHGELFDWLAGRGFTVDPGALGENITTAGLDVLTLPRGALLHIGGRAVVEVTGLRNPCSQIEDFQPGLLRELVGRNDDGGIVRRAGIMGVVLRGGPVRAGDRIAVELPEGPWQVLDRV
ncbi:MOSC domain-containing protein [Arthrobacter sp. A2-55]|uniref:MOSC domain-containing protein n=1 Tax=Arthrobacter sp. A2-55 TaxID=2897337 RepID=UPI0021CDDD18|nr:MOSC domain-containing protein [Arthrobacter sp. A2-55]MCU6481605.1 MOSC domain-containing protein [Arthrobacter sp. A2-55]